MHTIVVSLGGQACPTALAQHARDGFHGDAGEPVKGQTSRKKEEPSGDKDNQGTQLIRGHRSKVNHQIIKDGRFNLSITNWRPMRQKDSDAGLLLVTEERDIPTRAFTCVSTVDERKCFFLNQRVKLDKMLHTPH